MSYMRSKDGNREEKRMKFIITVCDEKGHELGTHEQQAEPHFANVSEIVTFDLKSFHVAMTRELYEKLAERKDNG